MKIILVEDHPIVRKGIKTLLKDDGRYDVCAEAESADEAVKLILDYKPDFAIIDIELKGTVNGIELIDTLRKRSIFLKVLAMSMDDGTLYAERAIKAGAKGYISKKDAPEKILTAIETIVKDELYIPIDIVTKITQNYLLGVSNKTDKELSDLTNRELQVFKLIGKGYKRKEIAAELGINVNTFESYRRKIREKFNLNNSAKLSKFAVKWFNENRN